MITRRRFLGTTALGAAAAAAVTPARALRVEEMAPQLNEAYLNAKPLIEGLAPLVRAETTSQSAASGTKVPLSSSAVSHSFLFMAISAR